MEPIQRGCDSADMSADRSFFGRAAEYRQREHSCLEAAIHAADQELSRVFLDLAVVWARLAKQWEASGAESNDELRAVNVLVIKPRPH